MVWIQNLSLQRKLLHLKNKIRVSSIYNTAADKAACFLLRLSEFYKQIPNQQTGEHTNYKNRKKLYSPYIFISLYSEIVTY